MPVSLRGPDQLAFRHHLLLPEPEDARLPGGVLHRGQALGREMQRAEEEALGAGVSADLLTAQAAGEHHLLHEQQLGHPKTLDPEL